MANKKTIQVACAIIVKNGQVLVTQRSEVMQQALKWEFPGGKLEAGESAEQCIVREIKEELGLAIELLKSLKSNTQNYTDFSICLIPFVAQIVSGNIVLKEHKAAIWLAPNELVQLDWAAADIPILENYLRSITNY